jgi:transposase-like protein
VALDARLARQLTAASRKQEQWRIRRDDLIREAAAQGASLREIAAAVGLSNTGVLRALRRLEMHHLTPPPDEDAAHDGEELELLTPNEHAIRHRGKLRSDGSPSK